MKNVISRLALASVLAVIVTGLAAQATAQEQKDTKKPKTTAAPKEAKKNLPFSGKIDALDKTAKTLKVGERSFQVTSATRIMKAGKPATFDDAKEGEEVGGSYTKTADGKLELVSLRIGPKPDAAPKPAKKEKAKTP